MLTSRSTYIGFSGLLILVFVADFFLTISLAVYIFIILVFISIIAWGTSVITSGFWIKTYCSGSPDKKTIALSFDDGPDRDVTPVVLDILKNNNIQAAFFCIGEKMAREPELVKRIAEEGHIIGNHTYSHHFFFDLFGRKKMADEILSTEEIIRKFTGESYKLFRPPYGVVNPPLAKVLKMNGFVVAGWSLRSKDTVIKDSDELMRRISSKLKNGDVLLLHDRLSHIPEVLVRFIDLAKSRGYDFERPDLLLKLNLYE